MNKSFLKGIALIAILSVGFTACKKDPKEAPKPDEQELITTLQLHVSNASGFSKTFTYKVENGFGNASAGSIVIDTLSLPASSSFDATLTVLNEKATPVEDITAEIIEKSEEHLFVFTSVPSTANGSISIAEGNKDAKGLPLNQTFTLNTSSAGAGSFEITLMHQPTNKNGTSPASAGGETDLDATFPVLLQ